MKILLTIFTLLFAASTAFCDDLTDAMAGAGMTAAEASNLQVVVTENPGDLSDCAKLLDYYFVRQFSSQKAKRARRKLILSIIKNHPAAPIAGSVHCELYPKLDATGYESAKTLWLNQVKANPSNTLVLGNAANFLFVFDKATAERLLKQAQKIDPKSPIWANRLGQLYALETDNTNVTVSKSAASKSLKEFETAQSHDSDPLSKFHRLDSLTEAALKAGDIEKASQYANELLSAARKYPNDWNYGNAIHEGNNVLGCIALRNGNIKRADEYLLKAGRTPGSPTLDSFGPNMELARGLLEKGETNTVLKYFELCRKFWSMGGQRLNEWASEVKAGNIPDFKANLGYRKRGVGTSR